jgi:UDP-N-acetylmuramate--alanine ligase
MAEFAGAFRDADRVEVLDIYAASEDPIEGVTAEALVRAMGDGGVRYAESVAKGVEALTGEAQPGDVIVTLGAGNVSHAGMAFIEALEDKK